MAPRLAIYGLLSTSLFLLTTLSALSSRPNFFSAAVAISRSSGSVMVMANFGVFGAILCGLGVRRVFFGRLRGVEYEHLFERLWMFLTESLLALTIFRDDFSASFAIMYGVLVFLKCFHWITADRVDYMDQIPPPGPPALFHIRVGSIITILSSLDLFLVLYSLDSILTDGVSGKVLFTSEFMILLASIWGTMARYFVSCLDLRRARGREDAPAWEEKSMYMFYIDLAVDFAKLLTYLSFFTVILLHYGIPLHILRDVWMTFRSFISRCSDLIRYRRATRDMDAQYPNATEEDVGRLGDRVCIICREEMVVRPAADAGGQGGRGASGDGPNETPKKLVCGHVFHFHCLRSWLERQQSCPTCRRDVLHNPVQNPRNRRAAPAPPAPGAVPQLNPAEQMRAQFNEFFRLPQENGAVPIPARPTPPPVPNGAAAAPGTNGLTPTPTQPATDVMPAASTEEEVNLQRSIWGGPIHPGRFFAAPLGATPRYGSTVAGLSSRPVGIQPIQTTAPNGLEADGGAPLSAPPGWSAPPTASTTPFSSNPPQVFRSISHSPDPAVSTPVPPVENQGESEEGETRHRRLAAEAAMRRLGITPSVKGKEKAADSAPTLATDRELDLGSEEPAQAPTRTRTQAPTRTPYLSIPPLSPPHPADRDGIDDRLRTLRAVDDTIWTLIEDLTKLKSQFEVSDGDQARSEDVMAEGEQGSFGPGVKARSAQGRRSETGLTG